jgi:hypothetical protein
MLKKLAIALNTHFPDYPSQKRPSKKLSENVFYFVLGFCESQAPDPIHPLIRINVSCSRIDRLFKIPTEECVKD